MDATTAGMEFSAHPALTMPWDARFSSTPSHPSDLGSLPLECVRYMVLFLEWRDTVSLGCVCRAVELVMSWKYVHSSSNPDHKVVVVCEGKVVAKPRSVRFDLTQHDGVWYRETRLKLSVAVTHKKQDLEPPRSCPTNDTLVSFTVGPRQKESVKPDGHLMVDVRSRFYPRPVMERRHNLVDVMSDGVWYEGVVLESTLDQVLVQVELHPDALPCWYLKYDRRLAPFRAFTHEWKSRVRPQSVVEVRRHDGSWSLGVVKERVADRVKVQESPGDHGNETASTHWVDVYNHRPRLSPAGVHCPYPQGYRDLFRALQDDNDRPLVYWSRFTDSSHDA